MQTPWNQEQCTTWVLIPPLEVAVLRSQNYPYPHCAIWGDYAFTNGFSISFLQNYQ